MAHRRQACRAVLRYARAKRARAADRRHGPRNCRGCSQEVIAPGTDVLMRFMVADDQRPANRREITSGAECYDRDCGRTAPARDCELAKPMRLRPRPMNGQPFIGCDVWGWQDTACRSFRPVDVASDAAVRFAYSRAAAKSGRGQRRDRAPTRKRTGTEGPPAAT